MLVLLRDAPEEIDLMALLLPDGQLPHCVDKFSLQYSMGAFKGWVKQRSPACAAQVHKLSPQHLAIHRSL